MEKYKNLSGLKFDRLLVEKRADDIHGRVDFLCKCDCGNTTIVTSRNLITRTTKSCGCLHREQLVNRNRKHNCRYTRLYRIYRNMLSRCYNEKTNNYKNYGYRKISVCDEWKKSFISFKNWADENGYKETLTIDRIDVNGDYEPNNCRWITQKKQGYNKTNTKYFNYNGENRCLAEWAEIFSINKHTLYNRIYNLGWDIKKALETKGSTK